MIAVLAIPRRLQLGSFCKSGKATQALFVLHFYPLHICYDPITWLISMYERSVTLPTTNQTLCSVWHLVVSETHSSKKEIKICTGLWVRGMKIRREGKDWFLKVWSLKVGKKGKNNLTRITSKNALSKSSYWITSRWHPCERQNNKQRDSHVIDFVLL